MARAKAAVKRPAAEQTVLRLQYSLAELPSAQHRAGLAGLVLMVRWLERQPGATGRCAIEVDDRGATLEVDLPGMKRLFDALYDASQEEQESGQLRKGRNGEVIPPLREEPRQSEAAGGKVKTRTVYIYPATVPRAGLLLEYDPTREGQKGSWVKLWRDMVWSTLRGVPATRAPFEARANREETNDAEEAWNVLTGRPDATVELPSTYYLGAMANSADNVPFRDRARFQFLLHFWPYATQVYVPAKLVVEEGKSRTEFDGFALAVPDVAHLDGFCQALRAALRTRGQEKLGFRPREAVVDLPVESALDMARRLRDRLARAEAGEADDLVLGYEVFHLAKEGNNVRMRSVARFEPDPVMTDHYARIRGHLKDPLFRRQRLLNLIQGRPWWAGFDTLIQTTSYKTQTLGSGMFCHDARVSFENEGGVIMENEGTPAPETGIDQLVYRLASSYIWRKVEAKTGLKWAEVKDIPDRRAEYNKAKERVAKDAFLAVRSRTGSDFIAYFTGTLCSVPQYLPAEQFQVLASGLHQDTEKLRTLTLLALSAQS